MASNIAINKRECCISNPFFSKTYELYFSFEKKFLDENSPEFIVLDNQDTSESFGEQLNYDLTYPDDVLSQDFRENKLPVRNKFSFY